MIDLQDYCEKTGIEKAQLLSRTRIVEVSVARQVYWLYLKKNDYGVCQIGRMFDREHGTIISGIKTASDLLEVKNKIAMDYYSNLI